jgi:hypothetical protein
MNKLVVEIWALVLLFVAFPLISLGTTGGNALVWWIGLIVLFVGSVLPVLTRFVSPTNIPDKPRDAGMEFDDRAS